jgi:hypothetical protein
VIGQRSTTRLRLISARCFEVRPSIEDVIPQTSALREETTGDLSLGAGKTTRSLPD